MHLPMQIALKSILPDHLVNNSFHERFQDEAKALARLNHPNIVGVKDFFPWDDQYILVMDYIKGESLEDLIRKRKSLTLGEALGIMASILDALDHAHQEEIVHRDVKPANIIINTKGEPILVDFGISRTQGKRHVTNPGQSIGTPEYMSPEQIKGEERIDRRTDVYSAGCVLYEMLTGRPPFGSGPHVDDSTIWYRHLHDKPDSLRNINSHVNVSTEAVVLKAMAKKPRERFSSCKEMADALKKSTVSVSEPNGGSGEPEGNIAKRTLNYIRVRLKEGNRRFLIIASFIIIFAVIYVVVILTRDDPEPGQSDIIGIDKLNQKKNNLMKAKNTADEAYKNASKLDGFPPQRPDIYLRAKELEQEANELLKNLDKDTHSENEKAMKNPFKQIELLRDKSKEQYDQATQQIENAGKMQHSLVEISKRYTNLKSESSPITNTDLDKKLKALANQIHAMNPYSADENDVKSLNKQLEEIEILITKLTTRTPEEVNEIVDNFITLFKQGKLDELVKISSFEDKQDKYLFRTIFKKHESTGELFTFLESSTEDITKRSNDEWCVSLVIDEAYNREENRLIVLNPKIDYKSFVICIPSDKKVRPIIRVLRLESS